jgi:hypothetical protein
VSNRRSLAKDLRPFCQTKRPPAAHSTRTVFPHLTSGLIWEEKGHRKLVEAPAVNRSADL